MKIRVNIDPHKALKVGSNFTGSQVVDLDVSLLTEEQRDILVQITSSKDGMLELDWRVTVPTAEAVISVIRERLEAQQEAQRIREERVATIQALAAKGADLPAEEFLLNPKHQLFNEAPRVTLDVLRAQSPCYIDYCELDSACRKQPWWPRVEALLAERTAQYEAHRRARADREAIAKERTRLEAEKLNAAKQATIDAWVAKHGTESMRERLAAGRLPRSEVCEAIEEQLFKPLATFAQFDSDQDQAEAVKELPPKAWERLKEIRAAVPDASLETYRYTYDEMEPPEVYTVSVTLRLEPLVFEREYRLGSK